jgi:IclR family acetate operon transcriptional repressor
MKTAEIARTTIRSVSRAARILLLIAEREGRTAKEVAVALELAVPTCHHLLNTLLAEGLLTKDSRRQYHLGPTVGALSDAFLRRIAPQEQLVAELRRLALATGETGYLSGWRNDEVVVLASVEGTHAVRVARLHAGFTGDAHARSSGKLLLALAPASVRELYLRNHPLSRLTGHTIVRRDMLESEFVRIQQRGYAFDEEEFREGVACVSAPVIDDGLISAAFTVSAPVERFRERQRELVGAVLAAARAMSSASTPKAALTAAVANLDGRSA